VPLAILFQVVLSIGSIVYLHIKKQTAQRGDAAAARLVVLPVFVPVLYICLICQAIHLVLTGYTFPNIPSWKQRARWEEVGVSMSDTWKYFTTMLSVTIEYNLMATLYIQKDLSSKSIFRSAGYVISYAVLTASVSAYCYNAGLSFFAFAVADGTFLGFECICYTFLLFKSVYFSRSTFLYFSIYSLLWRLLIVPSSMGTRNGMPEFYYLWVAFRALGFSPCLYITLIKETQYWTGYGRESLWLINREYGMPESVISNDLSKLLTENSLIDWTLLSFGEVLDVGGHSKVYKGRLRDRRRVAIKLFTPPEMDSASLRRFIEESGIAARLKHPHIVNFLGMSVRPPDICMVFEFCERGSLFKVLAQGPISSKRKLSFMIQAASALSYLHSLTPPIIHRDVKSHNFLVTESWMLKLADFGESRFVDTQMTGYIGSHAYMSPEIITSQAYDTKADVYSLGIVLWEIVTQMRPYAGIKQMSVLRNVVAGHLRPPIPSGLDEKLRNLIQSTWAPNPETRPTASHIINHLLEYRKSSQILEVGRKESKEFNGDFKQPHPDSEEIKSHNGSRWLLQNILEKELSEVEKQLGELAIRRMMISEQLQLQNHQKSSAQPLTRSMSIGGYGSLFQKESRSNMSSPKALHQSKRSKHHASARGSSLNRRRKSSNSSFTYAPQLHSSSRPEIKRISYSSDPQIRENKENMYPLLRR